MGNLGRNLAPVQRHVGSSNVGCKEFSLKAGCGNPLALSELGIQFGNVERLSLNHAELEVASAVTRWSSPSVRRDRCRFDPDGRSRKCNTEGPIFCVRPTTARAADQSFR
jgi:hypothetical protein